MRNPMNMVRKERIGQTGYTGGKEKSAPRRGIREVGQVNE